MDDIVTRCKHQLASFRIRELKAVLARLGLPKQGKKQVLLDKILGVFVPQERQEIGVIGSRTESRIFNQHIVTREEAAKVIDDIYRKLQTLGAADLASAVKNDPAKSCSLALSEEEDEDTTWEKANIRCPCGSSERRSTLLQCQCGVSQHMECVVLPDKRVENAALHLPDPFYCEVCCVELGDPFCVTLMHQLLPTKLNMSLQEGESSNPLQTIEKTFILSRSDRELLHRPNHDLQVWCVLLNDPVMFRLHWPAYAELRVNGVSVRVCNRPGTQLLGLSGRDEGPGISVCTREGTNRISLSAYDARPFCVGVRIIRRRTVQQVLSLIPSVTEGESIEEALSRVRRCFNGGNYQNMDDDDSDLEVVAESVTISLRCPISGSRIKIAGRFKPCIHMGGFNLKTFVELNQRARKWQCPICLKNYTLGDLIIDPLFSRITVMLKTYGEDVTEVEMKEGGVWRPKLEGEARFCEPWRLLDGTLFSGGNRKRFPEQDSSLKVVKEEKSSPKRLKSSKTDLKRVFVNDQLTKARKLSKAIQHSASHNSMTSADQSQSCSTADNNETADLEYGVQSTHIESHVSSSFGHPSILPRCSQPACGSQVQNGVEADKEKDMLVSSCERENQHHWDRAVRGSSSFMLEQICPSKKPNAGLLSDRFPPISCSNHSETNDTDSVQIGHVAELIPSAVHEIGNSRVALGCNFWADAETAAPSAFSVVYDFFSNNGENSLNAAAPTLVSEPQNPEQLALSLQHCPSMVFNTSEDLTCVSPTMEAVTLLNSQASPNSGCQASDGYSIDGGEPLQDLFPLQPMNTVDTWTNQTGSSWGAEMDSEWISLSMGIGTFDYFSQRK